MTQTSEHKSLRVDKYLWFARFFKTRSMAARCAREGRIRINGKKLQKSSDPVKIGDVLTFAQSREVRVIRVVDLGIRRGPAGEARKLYEDITPEDPQGPIPEEKFLAKMAK